MTGGPVREEVKLLFFNPIFHVSARAVNFIVEFTGVASKVGDEVAGVASFGGVLGFANDEPVMVPAVSFVMKPSEVALFFCAVLEGDFGSVEGGLKEGGDTGVASESDEVVDVVLLTPTQHTPTAKAGVGTEDDAHLRPCLAESFDEYF